MYNHIKSLQNINRYFDRLLIYLVHYTGPINFHLSNCYTPGPRFYNIILERTGHSTPNIIHGGIKIDTSMVPNMSPTTCFDVITFLNQIKYIIWNSSMYIFIKLVYTFHPEFIVQPHINYFIFNQSVIALFKYVNKRRIV